MANDRIYIKCKHCGEYFTLAKYYPSLGHGIWFPESLDAFIEDHMRHSPAFGKMDLEGDACFTLFAESDPNYQELVKKHV